MLPKSSHLKAQRNTYSIPTKLHQRLICVSTVRAMLARY